MIIFMCNIICVTNRALCREDFLTRLEKLAKSKPCGMILREKDLSEKEYEILAKEAIKICRQYDTLCILHSFTDVAQRLDWKAIHLPMPILRTLSGKERSMFTTLGASCHSAEEAVEAERLGCTYVTAGHIFDTDCKQGLPGRGLDFLKRVCESVSIPVYGIGGISPGNIAEVVKAGAKGGCVMSGTMVCEDPQQYLAACKEKANTC